MAVVKLRQFLGNIRDIALKRALYAIINQEIVDMIANNAVFNAHCHARVLGPAPGFATKATADPDIKTTATFYYIKSDGTIQSKSSGNIDVSAIAGYTPVALPGGKQRYFLITVADSDGAYGVTEGADHATAAVLPAAPSGKIPVGWCKCVNTTNPFTFGTTNSDAAGVTLTYADLAGVLAPNAVATGFSSPFINNVLQ